MMLYTEHWATAVAMGSTDSGYTREIRILCACGAISSSTADMMQHIASARRAERAGRPTLGEPQPQTA